MSKKGLKIAMRIFSMAMIIAMVLSTVAFAYEDITPSQPTEYSSNTVIKNVLGIIQIVGFIAAIGIIIVIGIRYLMASAAEKAEIKGNLVKYLIGAVLVAGGPTLVAVIFNAVSSGT